jgi:predicted dehydrogenase
MIASEKLDGIVAAQPFSRHGQLLPVLLNAGVPIFIEKPLAASLPVGRSILEQIQAANARVMVGYHKCSDPATVLAKNEIDDLKSSGEMGKLTYVRLTMPAGDWVSGGFADLIQGEDSDKPDYTTQAQDAPDPEMDSETRQAHESFVNYYIHQVNLMRHLLGEDYRVSYADPRGVLLVGESLSGIPCEIEMTPYQTSRDWQESAMVCFERGWVRLDLPAPLAAFRPGKLEIFKDLGGGAVPEARVLQLPWLGAMRAQAMNFLAFVRGEADPPCDAEEALKDLVVAGEYIRMVRS